METEVVKISTFGQVHLNGASGDGRRKKREESSVSHESGKVWYVQVSGQG